MATLKKIIICPYFGDSPMWWDKFEFPKGYDHIVDIDLEGFKQRVKDKLDIEYPGEWGNPKIWDYRSMLGLLYEDEIKGYDYWATCDFDMVFGDVDKWFPDEELKDLDVWSNHDTYICGCWTLYRNCDEVNKLIFKYPNWQEYLIKPETNGWIENEFSRFLEQSGLRYKYSFMQGDPYHPPFNLKKENGKLFQDGIEIPMLHFRRRKVYPL